MQNRDKNRSDEDRSRSDRSQEEMRGNSGRSSTPSRPSNPDRSSQDSESVLPRIESDSDSGYTSSSGRSRHITGEGESVDESDKSGSRGFESDSQRGNSGNGRTDRS